MFSYLKRDHAHETSFADLSFGSFCFLLTL